MSSFFGVMFVLFRFRLYACIVAATLRSIVLRCACAPTVTRSYGDVALSEYFCTIVVFSLYGGYVVRFLLPDGVFLPCDHGSDF